MPCLGSRSKSQNKASAGKKSKRPQSIVSTTSVAVSQIRQEYNELKTKNSEHLDMIARQSAELNELRQKLQAQQEQPSNDTRHQEMLASLQQKEEMLKQREQQIQDMMHKIEQEDLAQKTEDQARHQLAEKDELLRSKDKQLEELELKWESEHAELIKPALEEVTKQLEELKQTNKDAVARLAEKENELAELRSELTRRDRKPKMPDQERQKRMNRLTMDLENDRLLIQKLEELNQQLEAQKEKHESILQSHAQAMAEKDRALDEHQKSLAALQSSHAKAIKELERQQKSKLNELHLQHEQSLAQVKEKLANAEKQAKSQVNDEVERLLREFEQSEHDHSQQVASLQESHREQLSSMKKGQQAEIQGLLNASEHASVSMPVLRKTGGLGKIRWPISALQQHQALEVQPRDPAMVQVYLSSVSANSTIKRNQESIQTLLQSKQIEYQAVDVAKHETALQHMRRQHNGPKQLPQIFVGGEYRGQLDDLIKAVDDGQLAEFLRPRDVTDRRGSTFSTKSASSISSVGPTTPSHSTALASMRTPPVPTLANKVKPAKSYYHDEDEAMFKELEKELGHKDFSRIDVNF